MAAALPHGELMIVSGGTHVVPLERKEMVIDRVERFLIDRVIGGASLGAPSVRARGAGSSAPPAPPGAAGGPPSSAPPGSASSPPKRA
jgi:hypothetical protein